MQMLKKLFNSENKYFLELDDVKESEVVQTAVKTAKKAANVAKETASEVADTAQEKLQSTIATEDTDSKAKSEQPEPAADSQAKAKKNGKAVEKSESATQEKSTSTPENTGASSYEPPFWVAAMYNNNSSDNSNGRVAEPTFATDNLMPIITKSRRRPGGSLDKFKEMAKQAKTPKG
jgi:hypothetical protein